MHREPFLGQRDFSGRITRDFYNWEARLLRPRRRDIDHRFSRCFGKRVPKIDRRGIGELVRRHVFADAVPENILAQKALEHPQE